MFKSKQNEKNIFITCPHEMKLNLLNNNVRINNYFISFNHSHSIVPGGFDVIS